MGARIRYRDGQIATQSVGNLTVRTIKTNSGADHISAPEHSIFLIESDTTITDVWQGQRLKQREWKAGAVQFLPAATDISSAYVGRPYSETMISLTDRALRIAALDEVDVERIDLHFGEVPSSEVFGVTRTFMHLLRSKNPPPLLVETMAVAVSVAILCAMDPVATRALQDSKPGMTHAKLRRVQEYIETNLAKPVTLGEIASVAALSQYHFTRSFKAAMGISPLQYVWKRRVEKAKRIMLTTELPMQAVSHMAGFSSQSHFTTVFRRVTGASPTTWRRQAKN